MGRLLLLMALALLVAAPVAGAAQRRVPQSFYGVVWDRAVTDASFDQQDAQWSLMARSGVESVRTAFRWREAQPDPGVAPDFTRTDRIVELAVRHGITVLPVVYGTPPWAARHPARGEASPPRRATDWAAYLRQLVLRYGPDGSFWAEHPELPVRPLRDWQIWNEPHLGAYWYAKRGNAWARGYTRLLRASKRAIEAADPRARIVLAAMADYVWRHLARLYRAGAGGHFDVATVNLFTARTRFVMAGVRLFRRVMRRHGDARMQVWLTETTWPAGKDRVPTPEPAWQRAWYTTDAGMAKRLRGVYSLAASRRRRLRLTRVYWYTWASAYADGDLFDYTGLVRYDGGAFERRPALAVYRASARRHQGCVKTSAGTCAR